SRGSGMKIKILEAMAFGVPVVTTSEGVEGLPAEDGVHAGVCDDDDGLIERAVDLLQDPGRQERQARPRRAADPRRDRGHLLPYAGDDAMTKLPTRPWLVTGAAGFLGSHVVEHLLD